MQGFILSPVKITGGRPLLEAAGKEGGVFIDNYNPNIAYAIFSRMIRKWQLMKTLIFDFSRVILFPRDESYQGGLNKLHEELSLRPNYRFLDNFKFNEELLTFLEANKDRFELYIFTTGAIQNTPEVRARIKGIFRKVYTVAVLGLGKESPEAFGLLAKEIGKRPAETIFIDDKLGNIESAKKAGLKTIHFKNNKELFEDLKGF